MQLQLPLPGTGDHDQTIWFGSTQWQVDDGWATPLRLGRPTGVSEKLEAAAQCAVGVRAEFCTDASAVTLPIRGSDDVPQVVDLVVDDQLVDRAELDDHLLGFDLPGRPSRVEIWLPQRGTCRVGSLRLCDATTLTPPPRRPRWIAYGSSITHCSAADGPSSTWPALAARRLGWDLTCLGFNGLAHLDLPVATVIAAAQADIVTLCAGINIYNQATFTADELAQRIRDFVMIIRAAGSRSGRNPAPLALMSPITSPDREAQRNRLELTLQDIRQTVERAAHRVSGVSVISGPDVFGPDDADLLSDGLHPTAAGYRLMADRITPLLAGLTVAPPSGAQGSFHQAPTVVQQ